MAGLRCSLSWAEGGRMERRGDVRKSRGRGEERRRILSHGEAERESGKKKKENKHVRSRKLKKKKKEKKDNSFVPHPSFLHLPHRLSSPLSLSLFLSWERPGRAWPARHLLHNVTGWNSKSFISTHCLSSVCVHACVCVHSYSCIGTLKGCECLGACEISFYGCCDINSPGDDVERWV